MQFLVAVAVLEQDESTLVPVDASEWYPAREDATRSSVHVRPIAVEAASLTRAHESRPPHVEAADLALEQRPVYVEDCIGVGHTEIVSAGPDAV